MGVLDRAVRQMRQKFLKIKRKNSIIILINFFRQMHEALYCVKGGDGHDNRRAIVSGID